MMKARSKTPEDGQGGRKLRWSAVAGAEVGEEHVVLERSRFDSLHEEDGSDEVELLVQSDECVAVGVVGSTTACCGGAQWFTENPLLLSAFRGEGERRGGAGGCG